MTGQESQRYDLIDRLAEEFAARYRRGEHPSLQEYIDRHPDLADEIRELLPALAEMEQVKQDFVAPTQSETTGPPPLQQLGDFRILREVGKGGMGIVYEAEQVSLGRRVALKILPKQMLLEGQAKLRFEREARAAAKLHHTNIVPVFGVGEQDGLPYYVMQFIHGLGLDDVLDELRRMHGKEGSTTRAPLCVSRKDLSAADMAKSMLAGKLDVTASIEGAPPAEPTIVVKDKSKAPRLSDSFTLSSAPMEFPHGTADSRSLRARKPDYWQSVARIGVQVADALEYAHKQGILHRDIKPSNLLLDTGGTVWVADFGLAKSDDQQNITHTGDILGTLRYMPPEAFEGLTDPRSDVYSLGLTLYELLALQPAFAGNDRNKMVKEVMNTDPPRLDRLNPAIPHDLVTIVHKAIDREPGHRYQSASDLAADLQRFVDDEPIQARRLTQRERLWRTCRRHPAVASLTAALVLILVGVTVASVFAAAHFDYLAKEEAKAAKNERDARIEERKAKEQEAILRDRAEKNLKLAHANFLKSRAAVDDYLTKVSQNQLLDVPGMQPLRRDLLQSALTFYEDFVKQGGDDPELRAELAAAYLRVGQIQKELNDEAKMADAYAKGLKLYRSLLKDAPDSTAWQHGLAQCHMGLGQSPDAIAIWAKLVRPNQVPFQKVLADAYNMRALQHVKADLAVEAMDDHQKALAIREMLARLKPTDPDAHRDLGQSLNNIAANLGRRNRPAEALTLYRRAAAHAEVAVALAPQAIVYRRALANFLRNAGVTEAKLGHPKEALLLYERVVDIRAKLARDNPAIPDLQMDLLKAYCELSTRQRTADDDAAAQSLRRARDLVDRFPGDGPESLFHVACGRARLSAAERGEERTRQANLAMDALQKSIHGGFRNLYRLRTVPELVSLRGRPDFQVLEREMTASLEAEPALKLKVNRQALALWEKLANDDPNNLRLQADLAASQHAIGLVELDIGKLDESARAFAQAQAIRQKLIAQAPKNQRYRMHLAATALALGDVHWRCGRLSEWAASFRLAHEQLQADVDADPDEPSVANKRAAVLSAIVASYARNGMWDEAARLCAPSSARERFDAACLHLAANDAAAYRRLCVEFKTRLANSDDGAALTYLAAALSLTARSGEEPKAILSWAERAVAATKSDNRPRAETAWAECVLALALVRAGQPQSAIDAGESSMKAERPDAIVNYPILALAHHKLGHDVEAHAWLDKSIATWHRLSPLTTSVSSPVVLPTGDARYWDDHWGEWLAFQILLREASTTIAAKPPIADAFDQLHRGFMWSKLGDPKKADALLDAGVKTSADAEVWLARSNIFTTLGDDKRADADLAVALKAPSADVKTWIGYGRHAAEHKKDARADAAFARAAELAADDLNPFIEAGWWAVRTGDEDPRLPPGNQPDPREPLAGIKTGVKAEWRHAHSEPDGRVDLRAIFDANDIVVHAVTHVYAAHERTATLLVGGDDDMTLWLNGRPVYQQTRFIDWKPRGLDRVPVTLKAGKNTLLCRVPQTFGPHYFYVRLAESTFDRAPNDPGLKASADRTRAWLKTRDPATADFDLTIDLEPNEIGPLLARSRRYEELKRIKEADADIARAAELKSKNAVFWKQQARAAAACKQWRWALACFAQAETEPTDNAPFMWYEKSALCLLTNDMDGYRRTCARALTSRGKFPGYSYLAIRACTLGPNAVSDFGQFDKAANAELKDREAYYLPTITAGVHYRAGRFKEAADMLHKSLDDNPTWDGKVVNWLWLSLVCHRLGQKEEARQWLAKASAWLDRYATGMSHQPEGTIDLHLHGWLEAHVLRREAEQIVK